MELHVICQIKQLLMRAVFNTHITPHVRTVELSHTKIAITHFNHPFQSYTVKEKQ
nr:MAG TPA: hypothetical protein [Bacteriophage sp.]